MFEALDAVLLARIQFGFTIAFHIVFPALSIGLASYIAVLEGLWLWRGEDRYLSLLRYWTKPFALVFGMGVVSGVVMSYQFGTNWSAFSDKTGPVLGPLMGYEVMSAFFLEAGFLGVMLFGFDKVGPRLHYLATVMVALGTLLSAFWILSVNSWMQTPAGFAMNAAGQFVPADWWKVIFNPSFPYRLVHMVLAAYLSTALAVGAAAAWHLLRGSAGPLSRTALSMALWMILVVAPLQLFVGDLHGLNTLAHQPAKIAAIEGLFETRRGAPLLLFGVPDMAAETTRFAVEVPHLASLILTHRSDGLIRGLTSWPPAERPDATIVFWSFRIMVGLGLLMILLGAVAAYLRWRRRLFESRLFLRCVVLMGPAGLVALLAGWITTEVGRQPWTVYGLLTTAQSVSPIGAPGVAGSLAAFFVVYIVVFSTGIVYLLRLLCRSPDDASQPAADVQEGA